MVRRADRNLLRSQVPRLRRAVVAVFAAVYLFVGLVHASAHVGEVLAQVNDSALATVALAMNAPATDGTEDVGTKSSVVVDEHCQVCAPSVAPMLAFVAIPQARPVSLPFATAPRLVEDVRGLDTPPPKHLT